jgi:putative membrane protein
MTIIWHWLILCIALFATRYIVPSALTFHPTYIVLVVGACLYFVNATIKPLIGFFTLALNFLTIGLFSIVLNGAILYGLTFVISGFSVADFTSAIIGAVVVSVLNWILEMIF